LEDRFGGRKPSIGSVQFAMGKCGQLLRFELLRQRLLLITG
jgi:hypothetical protein